MEIQRKSDEKAVKEFLTGENFYAQQILGIHQKGHHFTFRVWAPHAQMIWLVGDFNEWQNTLGMEKDEESGVWEVTTSIAKTIE